MFETLLSHPKRLFLLIFLLASYGLYSGLQLPISLYPATSKPSVQMWVPYGNFSKKSFRENYGSSIEGQLKKISNSELKVDEVTARYENDGAEYFIEFAYEVPFDKAFKEVGIVASTMSSQLPKEIADRIGVWQRNENSGFYAASIYSDETTLRELYFQIKPILQPELDKITDAEEAVIWNPERYVISIKLIPEKLAQYGLFPTQIKNQLQDAFTSYSGSNVKLGKDFQKFEIAASIQEISDLSKLTLKIGQVDIFLKDIAEIDYGRDLHREKSFKTNGLSSLILWASPKSGANVRKMSQDIAQVLEAKKNSLPKGLKFKTLVDPSEAINKSILNLLKDVFLAACMAVLVLFVFIGGLRNVGTAVIEIPLSMVLSFILMKMAGMNINLISLGGLALAAGMNVDASVVILENIFKHRKLWHKQNKPCETFAQRITLVAGAVKEVALPVTLSIMTTLIVFIPMAFTADLTNAILGDLAKAVIFSHAISGLVALIIVPSVRVVLLKKYDPYTYTPMDRPMEKLTALYERILEKLITRPHIKPALVITPFIILAVLAYTILPHLPKEVIGKPSSDWIYMSITAVDTKSGRHMENIMQEIENDGLESLDGMVDYTWFNKRSRTRGSIMFKLLDRSDMEQAEKILKDKFPNTPTRYFYIGTWNPAELPLPRERHFKVNISGSEKDIFTTASKLKSYIQEKDYFDRIDVSPSVSKNFSFVFSPYPQRWKELQSHGYNISPNQIAEISQLTKEPLSVGTLELQQNSTHVKLSMNDERFMNPAMLKSYPIKIQDKIVPLSAFGSFTSVPQPKTILVRDGQEVVEIFGNVKDEQKRDWESIMQKVNSDIEANKNDFISGNSKIEVMYPQVELKNALGQLSQSLLLSLLLIFFILWMQFQSTQQVLIIMMTVPLGIIGVLISLYLFDSFLSLNSALGIILLNGITVNNSILLTDVTNTLRKKGLRGKSLIISACKKRLRPILITSLTTILGMTPVALGLGDGGKILQPLGIAVTMGLFFATTMTVFLVPVLLYKEEEENYLLDKMPEIVPADFDREGAPLS